MRDNLLVGAGAAFFGAFFGYCFSRLTDWIKSHVERRRLNKNSLVKLEHIFSAQLNEISDNFFVAASLRDTFAVSLNGPSPVVAHNIFHRIRVDQDVLLNLLNIDFINAVFSCQIGIDKINRSTDTFNRSYAEMRSGLIARTTSPATYQNNLPYFIQQLGIIEGALRKMESEIHTLAACARALQTKRYWLDSLSLRLSEGFDDTVIKKTAEERAKLLQEISGQAPAQVISKLREER